ncbi:MAG TPA: aspartate ammonia-lyase [Phycisphaerae bacterium]|nr:aspartate ammonia-lyase [Phycisphaerae bacterium]
MADRRTEHDMLGSRELPAGALWGIHTLRAAENFSSLAGHPVRPPLIRAYGAVKLACVMTNHNIDCLSDEQYAALSEACREMADGCLDAHIIVDALQGGAGTSTNMNVNEVLANRALQIMGHEPGCYEFISPSDHVNLHQSTNDTYPTALKVAAIVELGGLERAVVALLEEFQAKEKLFDDVVKVGRTQYQDAVLTTLGREMSAYAEAFARDRWRIYKCVERLRVVNLGGTAIGTGIGAPREFIFKAIENLRAVTSLGLARAENMIDATQNADVFVEVHGILKALASNLLKVSGDLRLISSGPEAGLGEIALPAMQAGSSIMPAKVNPVIPEAVSQAAICVFSNDQAVTTACSLGSLELNAFMPLIADSLLGSIDLLTKACALLREKCVAGITPNRAACQAHVQGSTASVTALLEKIGYEKAVQLAADAKAKNKTIRQAAVDSGLLSEKEFDELTSPQHVTQLGSRK